MARRADVISKIFTNILSVSSKSAGEFVQQIPLFKLNFKMSVIQVSVPGYWRESQTISPRIGYHVRWHNVLWLFLRGKFLPKGM